MAKEIIRKRSFDKSYRSLSEEDKLHVDQALKDFWKYLETGHASAGLGLKHLGSKTYEFRAGLSLRVVYVSLQDRVILCLLGAHDEVRRYLKRG